MTYQAQWSLVLTKVSVRPTNVRAQVRICVQYLKNKLMTDYGVTLDLSLLI